MEWRIARVVTTAALAVAAAAPSFAAAQQPRVRTELDTALVNVGDRLGLTVSVEHAPDATVIWPDSLDLSPFEVLRGEVVPPRAASGSGSGTEVSALHLTLTVFELGDLELPSFPVAVVQAGDTADLATDAWRVTVTSVGLDEGGGIRDIKGPLAIPLNVLILAPWALLLLALLALGIWWWRRRSGPEEETARLGVNIPRSPHVVALEALDRLAASGMLDRGEVEAFHVAVSEIVRTYIEARFDVWALEMTTGEVVAGLRDVGLVPAVILDVRDFLERCDLVKFAKVRPLPRDSEPLLDAARAIVERTRPRTDPTPVAPDEPPDPGSGDDPDPATDGEAA